MDLVRFGLIIRALRRRSGWRQLDLAAAAGVSQSVVSDVERGHADRVALRVLLRIAAALGARLLLDVRWRGGELDRLLDADHAALAATLAGRLRELGWDVRVEVTYSTPRAAGSIDLLAWHAATGSLLVVEIKTEITSAEATIRKLDEKARLAAAIAFDAFGWRSTTTSRLLVVEDRRTSRRRVELHEELFRAALPAMAVAVRRWLRDPSDAIAGIWFLSPTAGGGRMSKRGGRHRVRRSALPAASTGPRSAEHDRRPETGRPVPTILTNRT